MTIQKLESARFDTISRLGIGGYIPASEFASVYEGIDATLFAKIMYATEQMSYELSTEEAVDPTLIQATIEMHDFTTMPHFALVKQIFISHFGQEDFKTTSA